MIFTFSGVPNSRPSLSQSCPLSVTTTAIGSSLLDQTLQICHPMLSPLDLGK